MRATLLALLALAPAATAGPIHFEKVVLDRKFRSEGVAVADVNGDGKLDVLTGEHWYAAPDWTPHPMRPVVDHKDGLHNYSRVFACWADDFNHDGKPDLLVVGFPGLPCYWMENPGSAGGDWKTHTVWHSACNETPLYADLLGTGKSVLIMGTQPKGAKPEGDAGEVAYFAPAADPNAPWEMHPVSGRKPDGKGTPGSARFAHGLGVGDVNGDGKLDVICTGGWWQQPATADGKAPWAFHPADLGPASADIYAIDLDGDGKAEIVNSSAHKYGIWAYKAAGDKFTRTDLFPNLVSETHALKRVDLDGDGVTDFVTGKRFWSHGTSEPGADKPAVVVMLRGQKSPTGGLTFEPVILDGDSGIGTQFVVIDVDGDGKLDVVTSNKKGVRVLFQRP